DQKGFPEMKANLLNAVRTRVAHRFSTILKGVVAAGLLLTVAAASFGQTGGAFPRAARGYDSLRHESRYSPVSCLPRSGNENFDSLYEQYLREYGLEGGRSTPGEFDTERWRYPDRGRPMRPTLPTRPTPTLPTTPTVPSTPWQPA